jgi:DUF1009 family protein
MASVNASVLAVEAGRTIILDRDLTLKHAKSARIAVVGIVKPPPQNGGS